MPKTLKELLLPFPRTMTGSRWPGLRIAADLFSTFRVVLDLRDDDLALVKGVKGPKARRTYATINLKTGAIGDGDKGACPDRLRALLTDLYSDPVGFTSRHGRDMGVCCFCAANLTTRESRERGYGPLCAKRWGLPWG